MPDLKSLNDDFPVPFAVFAAKLKDTPEEVWTKHLQNLYGNRKISERQWGKLLASVQGA